MKRDQSWGDLGLNEAVWLGKKRGARESYSLFAEDDCEKRAAMKDVIAVIDRRRKMRPSRQLFEALFQRITQKPKRP